MDEFPTLPRWKPQRRHLRAAIGPRIILVDYPAVAEVKLAALRAAYPASSTRGSEVAPSGFRGLPQRARAGARMLCSPFETLREHFPAAAPGGNGRRSGERPAMRRCARAARATCRSRIGFHEYLQWHADGQLQAAATSRADRGCRSASISTLAVGVDPGGADAWIGQGDMLHRALGRRAARPVQSGRPGLGSDRIQSAWTCRRQTSSRSGRCCARRCATPAHSASTMCWG